MTAFLPQRDPDPQKRERELTEKRERYQFNYQHVPPLAILNRVPVEDEFCFDWLTKVAERVLVGLANRAELDGDSQLKEYHHIRRGMLSRLISIGENACADIKMLIEDALKFHGRIGAPTRPAESLQEFVDLYRTIGLPPIAKDFMEDRAYAAMRTAGPNPVMLQRMSAADPRLPVTDELFQLAVPGDSLDAAMAEGRLYLADYAVLDGAELGDYPHGQKYLYAPLALFVIEADSKLLVPIAIQCQQQPGPKNPVFTPADGWNWTIAKTIVEIADGNVHEARTHLGRTHLLMEPFVVSAFRQLAPDHPLSVLLISHFEGTLAINAAAWQHLIADRGAVDKLFGGTIKTSRTVAAEGVRSVRVMQDLLPKTFAARGVDDTEVFPYYPYRDDALLYWNAIRQWVRDYVDLYYFADAEVQGDAELQAWLGEVAANDGGRIGGLVQDGSLARIEDLVDIVTFIIYTCSVQHAAVNFPQYDLMSFAPNMPLASYRPAPTSKDGASEADFIAMLPTLDMAELQMELGYLLGTVHYTQLGQYPRHHFADHRIEEPLKRFQRSLSEIGNEIDERNQVRHPYETLCPAGIPQSINI